MNSDLIAYYTVGVSWLVKASIILGNTILVLILNYIACKRLKVKLMENRKVVGVTMLIAILLMTYCISTATDKVHVALDNAEVSTTQIEVTNECDISTQERNYISINGKKEYVMLSDSLKYVENSNKGNILVIDKVNYIIKPKWYISKKDIERINGLTFYYVKEVHKSSKK